MWYIDCIAWSFSREWTLWIYPSVWNDTCRLNINMAKCSDGPIYIFWQHSKLVRFFSNIIIFKSKGRSESCHSRQTLIKQESLMAIESVPVKFWLLNDICLNSLQKKVYVNQFTYLILPSKHIGLGNISDLRLWKMIFHPCVCIINKKWIENHMKIIITNSYIHLSTVDNIKL